MKMHVSVLPEFRRKISFLFLLFIAALNVHAQSNHDYYEYGTVDTAWIRKRIYEKDTTAEAVILYNYGKCVSEPYRGEKLTVQRTIKVLKKSGIEPWGSLTIDTNDKLIKFSAVVYNYENGKLTTDRIDLEQMMKEKQKGYTSSSIAFPNVKPGSIIEYTYTIKTNQYSIFRWDFQFTVPVRYSEYEVFFPGSLFGASAIINGTYLLHITTKEKGNVKTYKLFDVPAFKKEPFMPPSDWYRSSIQFTDGFGSGKAEIYRLKYIEEHGMIRDSVKMDTKTLAEVDFKIDPQGLLVGALNLTWSGYGATEARKEIQDSGEENFLKDNHTGRQWDITKQVLENVDDADKNLVARYEVSIADNIQVTDSLLYINPFLALKEEQNPFKLEQRLYPVDLVSRTEKTMVAQLTIPEGYEVDELPKSEMLALPNKAGTFIASVTHQGNKIYITSKIKFNKIVFNVPDYPSLREFYLQIIARKSRLIVLRKIKK